MEELRALRSQAIVKLTALRKLAAEGKLAAALSWIEDFVQSDEKLVVFAHHRAVQTAIVELFPDSARILGTDSLEAREANVLRFQAEDGPALCVCSMEAASQGFTLTASANVAFLELAWTPAKHDQAEDRVHRIGQDRGVTAWYLLAADTIDERLARLLDEKRAVVDAVADGREAEGGALVGELLREMVGGLSYERPTRRSLPHAPATS
ncbi:MAG TPA: C-terminal helicase domain-containing protein [Baekduia sp.]|nr:C-terminal helicase domain-containing protein [Baekduia sp.]